MKRLHAIVKGRVQGVYFRDFVNTHAEQLHLTGWVQNLPDGTVEVTAEGEDAALSHLKLFLEKGSPMSRVDDVDATYSGPTGEYTAFEIRP
ncbi:MAG TPA: acylphosphatase [Armatimonadota bacterium]|nr:acylphosphatase [Armatimonadota bacterium]